MRHVDNAHLDLSANRPPFHTPGKMIEHISINREKAEWSNGHDKDRQTGISAKKKKRLSGYGCESSWNKVLNKCFMKHLLDSVCKRARWCLSRHPPHWETWWSWSLCRHQCQTWQTASSSSRNTSWGKRTSPSQWDGKPPRRRQPSGRGKSEQKDDGEGGSTYV